MSNDQRARWKQPSHWCIHANDNDLTIAHHPSTCVLCQQLGELASYMRDPLNPDHAITSLSLVGVCEDTLDYELKMVMRCLLRAQCLKEREHDYSFSLSNLGCEDVEEYVLNCLRDRSEVYKSRVFKTLAKTLTWLHASGKSEHPGLINSRLLKELEVKVRQQAKRANREQPKRGRVPTLQQLLVMKANLDKAARAAVVDCLTRVKQQLPNCAHNTFELPSREIAGSWIPLIQYMKKLVRNDILKPEHFSVGEAYLIQSAVMISFCLGHHPPLRISCITSVQVPSQARCDNKKCPKGCKGNLIEWDPSGHNVKFRIPHNKTNRGLKHTANSGVIEVPVTREQQWLLYLAVTVSHPRFANGKPSRWLFLTSTGKQFASNNASSWYQQSVMKYRPEGMPVSCLQTLRHAYAVALMDNPELGPGLPEAAALMGTSVKMLTQCYDVRGFARRCETAVRDGQRLYQSVHQTPQGTTTPEEQDQLADNDVQQQQQQQHNVLHRTTAPVPAQRKKTATSRAASKSQHTRNTRRVSNLAQPSSNYDFDDVSSSEEEQYSEYSETEESLSTDSSLQDVSADPEDDSDNHPARTHRPAGNTRQPLATSKKVLYTQQQPVDSRETSETPASTSSFSSLNYISSDDCHSEQAPPTVGIGEEVSCKDGTTSTEIESCDEQPQQQQAQMRGTGACDTGRERQKVRASGSCLETGMQAEKKPTCIQQAAGKPTGTPTSRLAKSVEVISLLSSDDEQPPVTKPGSNQMRTQHGPTSQPQPMSRIAANAAQSPDPALKRRLALRLLPPMLTTTGNKRPADVLSDKPPKKSPAARTTYCMLSDDEDL